MEQQLPQPIVRQAYPDALPCLEKVRRLGLKTGIVSNIESEQRLRKELELIGLSQFFPVLVVSGSVGDDPERDYQGAFKARMNPVLIDRGERYRNLTDVNRLSSLKQVPKLVPRRGARIPPNECEL